MEQRLRFVARLLEGEKMAELCREFEISRKIGYKIFHRYRDLGLEGLTDRSRGPFRPANKLPMQIEKMIVKLKREHRAGEHRKSARSYVGGVDVLTPAISTVHVLLDPYKMVQTVARSLGTFTFGAPRTADLTGVERRLRLRPVVN